MRVKSGTRFKKCVKNVSKNKGVTNPDAVCAYIGRKKYGKKKFEQLALRGKKLAKK